jgi:hypothetical protein
VRERLGVALFVLGSTFLWIVPPFAGSLDRSTILSDALHVLGIATIAVFGVAAWALARGLLWSPLASRWAAVLGLLTCAAVAAVDVAVWRDALFGLDVLAHAAGCVSLLVLAAAPAVRSTLGDRWRELEDRRRTWYPD